MEYEYLLCYLTVLLMLFGKTSASLPPREYWAWKLPNTPMPESIKYILPPIGEAMSNKGYTGRSNVARKHNVSDDYDPALFFKEKDLHLGDKWTLQFSKKTYPASFLPHPVASSIPFSSRRLSEILDRFSLRTNSPEAIAIEKTLWHCELPANFKGEARQCVTSLESMVDFIMTNLGKNVRAVTTSINNNNVYGHNAYTVEGMEKLKGRKFAVCHKRNYLYAVYECHTFDIAKAHVVRVPFKGSDGLKAESLAACHNYAYPFQKIFQDICKKLNAKPGVDTVCHFLAQDTTVWQLIEN